MDYYDVLPRIVPADQWSEIRIHPRFDHAKIRHDDRVKIQVFADPVEGRTPDRQLNYNWTEDDFPQPEWRWEEDDLVIRHFFCTEQEYNLRVEVQGEKIPQEKQHLSFRVYSLLPDLYELRPFKGDFHIHTTGSDGKEAPAYVAARYREKGFDFAAISDHRQYEYSVEARDFFRDLDLDFKLYPGEEVHSPGNPVHIVNFGGNFSVNELYRQEPEKYEKEVREILETLPKPIAGLDYYPVAASQWVFDRIRQGGGLAVFCHPYWYISTYAIGEALTDAIFAERKFDAFEVIGGFFLHQFESNNFQVNRYMEERGKGNRFPVVGLSDCHATDTFRLSGHTSSRIGMEYVNSRDGNLFGWNYTVILAKSDAVEDLIAGVRAYHSAAVSEPTGERPGIYGEFRIVKYVSFLMREFFPEHDRLCRPEGAAMLDHLAGDPAGAAMLKVINGRVKAYREQAFAGNCIR